MIRKITKVVVTIVFFMILLVDFSSLAIAQEELGRVFKDRMISKYGEEAYIKFEERISELRHWLTAEKMPERVRKDAAFIIMYERICRWVETGQLAGPAVDEASEFLEMNFDRFIDSSEDILDQLMTTTVLMEKSEVHNYLEEYRGFLWEIANSPQVKNLLLEKETEILVEIGNTRSYSRKLLQEAQELREPTRIVKSETIRIVLSKYSKDRIRENAENREWRNRLIISVVQVTGGTGLLVGDLAAAVPPSAPFAAYFIGKGLDGLISLF